MKTASRAGARFTAPKRTRPRNSSAGGTLVPARPETLAVDTTRTSTTISGELDVERLLTALTALKRGDFSVRLPIDGSGAAGKVADMFNDVAERLEQFTGDLLEVSHVVGKEGRIAERMVLAGAGGSWTGQRKAVNSLIGDLVHPTSEISRVIGAVADGDLSSRMTLEIDNHPLQGEFLKTAKTVNTMVDQLGSFASEVTRVAREVGTEGKLGGQAKVKAVAGTWKDLTDNVNLMASNLTSQVRNIATVTTAVAKGDLTKKITVDVQGEFLELKATINTMVDQLRSFASEVTRVAREVGTEGRLGGQARVEGVSGTWKGLTDNVNFMASNLTSQVRNIADVTTAVANGDLSKKITVDVKGEILELKNTINTMVDQLRSFASEVTRVAREVGTEGKLGGQADVRDVAGTWKDLTDNVNFMASNLTSQVRGIAKVVTAVANGDLKPKLLLDAKGEIAELSETINGMTDTLATFADQVTSVAREVGVDGRLGGQASVPGAAGTWKDLTENVNRLAANLTAQVRAIAEVSTAVTKGDLTRSITVEARGEVASLKDNINEMIRNLKDTTLKNSEQDWLKTNLAKFSRMLQGQKDLLTVSKLILSELAPTVNAQHGVFYTMQTVEGEPELRLLASYAFRKRKDVAARFRLGEGLVGQAALERERILLTDVPGDYVLIHSGLGGGAPLNLIVLPVVFEGEVKAVIELASFSRFSATHQAFLDQLMESVGIVLNTIEANMRTEDLLEQSQSLAKELQSQQDELQLKNLELEEKARLLASQNVEVERKNHEIEHARRALEEKASQLALTSRYKSEFLANMSHELRTPLNSLLILADQLASNVEHNLTSRQVEFAKTIHASGNDLMRLINEILDLAKIESGTVILDVAEVSFTEVAEFIERTFRPVAESKGLAFTIRLDPALPAVMRTDAKRLQQVLKNLVSNALKFTEDGGVDLEVIPVSDGANGERASARVPRVAFRVNDTGIGIPVVKQHIIFEAFQQVDGSTSRRYGGTGLGLAISREIARLLGGDISLASEEGKGSTFTFHLPLSFESTPGATARERKGVPLPVGMGSAWLRDGAVRAAPNAPLIQDDRESILNGDRVLLVVDDDVALARTALEAAHDRGWKALIAATGSQAIDWIHRHAVIGITLDLKLPDMDGWHLLRVLKSDPATRHIPLTLISGTDDGQRGLMQGAISHRMKPLDRPAVDEMLDRIARIRECSVKQLLIVEPDAEQQRRLLELIGNGDVAATAVRSGREGLASLAARPFDCVVVEPELPDMSGRDFIEQVEKAGVRDVPILVYTPYPPGNDEAAWLESIARTVMVKNVDSPERLLDETVLFLHRPAERLAESQRKLLDRLRERDTTLTGRKALVVDDDIRNVFALTSLLERHGMSVVSADDGMHALEALRTTPGIEIVLMDIMMPDMDGYETMRAIRKSPEHLRIPIIALTAKAMKGDREKCIEAGASDYIAKPADSAQLVAALRVWLRS